nr:leucine-rich repeat domain-containing protein [Anabaena sp. UHCC 0204]
MTWLEELSLSDNQITTLPNAIAQLHNLTYLSALQLRNDERLSDESFLELMKLVIEQLPLIGNVVNQLTSKDK